VLFSAGAGTSVAWIDHISEHFRVGWTNLCFQKQAKQLDCSNKLNHAMAGRSSKIREMKQEASRVNLELTHTNMVMEEIGYQVLKPLSSLTAQFKLGATKSFAECLKTAQTVASLSRMQTSGPSRKNSHREMPE
jgi:hypothetical protein